MPIVDKKTFSIGITRDFYTPDGAAKYRDFGLSIVDNQNDFRCSSLDRSSHELTPEEIDGQNGVVVLTPAVTARSVAAADELLAIGRFGVGYDAVDTAACTAADVAVFITAGAVDHSVAEATVGWMLALTHRLRTKDTLVRQARWDERSGYMGSELRDRVFGAIGLGGIARATLDMLKGFRMAQPLVYDPFVDPAIADKYGARVVALDELLSHADFVSIHCPLNANTRELIGERELGLMKPEAYLINTARGGIVDEVALYNALRNNQIAGAALDCFANEPLKEAPSFSTLGNVLLAPHSIAWTHELFRDIGRSVFTQMLEIARGKRPHGVVNPEVFERRSFQEKWQRLQVG